MANIILGYAIIGLILSALYVGKKEDTDIMRRLSKPNYIAALLFTTALITLFWFPIGVFALVGAYKQVKSDE